MTTYAKTPKPDARGLWTPWRVSCPSCGDVCLMTHEYNDQLHRPDVKWACPVCGQEAFWDDEHEERFYGDGDGALTLVTGATLALALCSLLGCSNLAVDAGPSDAGPPLMGDAEGPLAALVEIPSVRLVASDTDYFGVQPTCVSEVEERFELSVLLWSRRGVLLGAAGYDALCTPEGRRHFGRVFAGDWRASCPDLRLDIAYRDGAGQLRGVASWRLDSLCAGASPVDMRP
jgi:ribosomal protein S27AE